ncbi:spore coat protein [Anaeromicrobium sediminis]|uniref:Spore coat protein n=1 Tax=Anaeromicrobium sediminis TaxID=1478221 RepID=A0A267MI97_9FIRM|nr:spore coat protein [Anaeromicrobium sediminis]PAB59299.1 hypothetical protein CCE28_10570 [Anaeromicrobium sediminis]
MKFHPYLSEKELLKDLLMSENQLSLSYTNSMTKSPSINLRQLLYECEKNVLQNQENIVNAMNKRGWNLSDQADYHYVLNVQDKYNSLLKDM